MSLLISALWNYLRFEAIFVSLFWEIRIFSFDIIVSVCYINFEYFAAIEDGSLSEFINALVWNDEVTKSYYRPTALLRQEDQVREITPALQRDK